MDTRRRVTAVLVALIVIVPVSAATYYFLGPTRLGSLDIGTISPDDQDRKGIYIIGSATVGGRSFSKEADLLVFHNDEQVYAGKVKFNSNLLDAFVPLEKFAVENGEYEFRIRYGETVARYYYELDMLVEQLGVFATAAYNINQPGYKPYYCAYSYTVTFQTGWHWWTETVDPGSFYTWDLGYVGAGNRTTYKLESSVDGGLTAKVFFTDLAGRESLTSSYSIPAGTSYTGTVDHEFNGSYKINFYDELTVPLSIKVFQNRATKTPRPQDVKATLTLGQKQQSVLIGANKTEVVTGNIRPALGPGYYDVNLTYDQPLAAQGSNFRTVSNSATILLNDKPYADVSAGNPYELSALKHTLRFDATNSRDDGPMADVYVYWSFGQTSTGGLIGSAEGPWDQYKVVTFIYGAEFPDGTDGKPYLVLKDAYNATSDIAFVNVQVG